MATTCDSCEAKEDVKPVALQTSSGVQAKSDLCPDCRKKLPEVIERIGFTLPDEEDKPSGLG